METQVTQIVTLGWGLLIVALTLVLCAAAFMVIAVVSVNRAIRRMAETCSEAMDNVVAACDLPAAIYVKEQRELRVLQKEEEARNRAGRAEKRPADANPPQIERVYVK